MAQGQPYGTEKVVMISTVAQGAPIVGPPQWTQTLCGCADNCSIFCEEFWCAYCHLGYLYDTIETGGRDMDPLVCCGALCIDYFIGGLARCIVIMHLRDRIIHRYGIQEGGVKTCCISCWCSSCAMCQMHRELEGRHEYTGGCCYTAPVPAGAPMGAMAGSEQKPQTGQPGQPQPYQYPQEPYAQQQQQQQQHTTVSATCTPSIPAAAAVRAAAPVPSTVSSAATAAAVPAATRAAGLRAAATPAADSPATPPRPSDAPRPAFGPPIFTEDRVTVRSGQTGQHSDKHMYSQATQNWLYPIPRILHTLMPSAHTHTPDSTQPIFDWRHNAASASQAERRTPFTHLHVAH
jgi:Cys-rich protein (TIGR01571 family)